MKNDDSPTTLEPGLAAEPDARSTAVLDHDACFICEREPGTVEALCDDKPVLVCQGCFDYETGEDPEEDAA